MEQQGGRVLWGAQGSGKGTGGGTAGHQLQRQGSRAAVVRVSCCGKKGTAVE